MRLPRSGGVRVGYECRLVQALDHRVAQDLSEGVLTCEALHSGDVENFLTQKSVQQALLAGIAVDGVAGATALNSGNQAPVWAWARSRFSTSPTQAFGFGIWASASISFLPAAGCGAAELTLCVGPAIATTLRGDSSNGLDGCQIPLGQVGWLIGQVLSLLKIL